MRIAQAELDASFTEERILPVYMSFVKSSLIHTSDPQQFQHWMLAKVCSRVLRVLRNKGLVLPTNAAVSLLTGGSQLQQEPSALEALEHAYENSYKTPGSTIDPSMVPEIDDFKDSIEDICRQHRISRLCLLFDEAIHIFLPEQQRQFFTVFRDLRSPFIGCNAAVYPGVTSYGSVFELTHDATLRRLERDILAPNYVENMKDIVLRQAASDTSLVSAINRNGANFAVLAYCVSGNPRLLLKTVQKCPNLKTGEVNDLVKEFYRSTIWAEHSGLAESYAGHAALIEWGRNFVEREVLPQNQSQERQEIVRGTKRVHLLRLGTQGRPGNSQARAQVVGVHRNCSKRG
jgi:hypothetical protein